MGTFQRVRRSNVDNSPNQIITNNDPTISVAVVGYRFTNPTLNEDVWIRGYNNTSGVVTLGVTPPSYGPILVPSGTQVVSEGATEQNPLMIFTNGATFTATTSEDDSITTSPTLDISIELTYFR